MKTIENGFFLALTPLPSSICAAGGLGKSKTPCAFTSKAGFSRRRGSQCPRSSQTLEVGQASARISPSEPLRLPIARENPIETFENHIKSMKTIQKHPFGPGFRPPGAAWPSNGRGTKTCGSRAIFGPLSASSGGRIGSQWSARMVMCKAELSSRSLKASFTTAFGISSLGI